ncbi:hypothetical protein DH86_00001614 [Scytalidium sp. 3C]|nr:hypothetical protein DH86_00001614 [Scytalidium sp. 3C]
MVYWGAQPVLHHGGFLIVQISPLRGPLQVTQSLRRAKGRS